ncbi:MAG: tRNA lysidine(34) synthetase TilS [Gemmatimonadaceae bacterium]
MLRPVEGIEIENCVRGMLDTHPRLVLAVSGGADSMALLSAAARVAHPGHHVSVAAFDHGTGSAAREGVRLAERAASDAGFLFFTQRAANVAPREAAWRAARWSFLRSVATSQGAAIATAHTRDDQLETVVMRILRGAGTRGLVGLLAASDVVRPLLATGRSEVRAYADALRLEYMDDPSNQDRSYLRNRVRLDLLPALTRARPGLDQELHQLAREANALRTAVEAVASGLATREIGAGVSVPISAFAGLAAEALAWLWPAILALAGVVADRRGIDRLVEQTIHGRSGIVTPLSGGFEVVRGRRDFQVRRTTRVSSIVGVLDAGVGTTIGQWRFSPMEVTTIKGEVNGRDLWQAVLAAGPAYVVRAWRAGDRLQAQPGGKARRVARFFEDAGVSASERRGWPVVVAGEDVVWIPGIRRGHAATARSGGPYVVYKCERDYSRSET